MMESRNPSPRSAVAVFGEGVLPVISGHRRSFEKLGIDQFSREPVLVVCLGFRPGGETKFSPDLVTKQVCV